MRKDLIKQVCKFGIDFNMLAILIAVDQSLDLEYSRTEGWLTLAAKKDLVIQLDSRIVLTEEGQRIVTEFYSLIKDEPIPKITPITIPPDFFTKLHTELQTKLKELTGKKQILVDRSYQFLCGPLELKTRLSDVMKKHKLSDLNIIRKVLLDHVVKAFNKNFEKQRLVKYFIYKDKLENSDLASAYGSWEEKEEPTFIKTSIETFI